MATVFLLRLCTPLTMYLEKNYIVSGVAPPFPKPNPHKSVPFKSPTTKGFRHFGSAKMNEAKAFIYLIFYLIAVTSK
jgi:hypothetical protein